MLVDGYAHALPAKFQEEITRRLGYNPMPIRLRQLRALSELDARIALMDEFGLAQQVICTIPTTALEDFFGRGTGAQMAEKLNESMAELIQAQPDRLIGVATVFLFAMDAALRELERSVRELGFKGVLLHANVGGRPVDDPAFFPFYEAVQEFNVPIWLHPARQPSHPDYMGEESSRYNIWYVFGWPYETSLAMARLVFSGVLDRYPRLKIIAHHGAGWCHSWGSASRSSMRNGNPLGMSDQ